MIVMSILARDSSINAYGPCYISAHYLGHTRSSGVRPANDGTETDAERYKDQWTMFHRLCEQCQ